MVDNPQPAEFWFDSKKGNRSPYRAYFVGEGAEGNSDQDVRHNADKLPDQGGLMVVCTRKTKR